MYDIISKVLECAKQHEDTWKDYPESYWLSRLVGECSDLGLWAVQSGWDSGDVDRQLVVIASTLLNWLRHREADNSSEMKKTKKFRRFLKG